MTSLEQVTEVVGGGGKASTMHFSFVVGMAGAEAQREGGRMGRGGCGTQGKDTGCCRMVDKVVSLCVS